MKTTERLFICVLIVSIPAWLFSFSASTPTWNSNLVPSSFKISIYGNHENLIMSCNETLECEYKKEDSDEIIHVLLKDFCRERAGGCRNYE